MVKIIRVIIIIIILMQICYGSSNKKDMARRHYLRGVRYYVKRDFKKATEELLKSLEINYKDKKAQRYMNKAQDKYYKSLSLFFEGINYFIDAKYKMAIEKFKSSLLINPLDERTKYYLKLCYVPKISIRASRKVFSDDKQANQFFINIDTRKTIPNWVEKWELRIEDMDRNIIKKVEGEGEPPKVIDWDLKDEDNKRCSAEKVRYYLLLTSLYGRVVSSRTNTVKIAKEVLYSKAKMEKLLERKKGEDVIKFTMASAVLFDFDSVVLKKKAKEILKSLVEFLKQNKRYNVILSGHTDNIGSDRYNLRLSKLRALSVKRYLVRKGIESKRIKSYGYGERYPIASNRTAEGREKNRRVEFKLILKK